MDEVQALRSRPDEVAEKGGGKRHESLPLGEQAS
jgi:hypothetical protein